MMITADSNTESKNKSNTDSSIKSKKKSKKINEAELLKLKVNNNLSYRQIAQVTGIPKPTVYSKIKHLLPTQETEIYKQHKADILAHLQLKLLNQLDDKRLKKMSPAQAVLAAMQLNTNERLERGQSTENTMLLHADIAKIKELDKKNLKKMKTRGTVYA